MSALQEKRWKETGQIRVNDYGIYFSGMVDRHSYRNDFTVHKSLVPHIKDFRPVSESIAVLRTNRRPIDITFVFVYAPTDTSGDNVKDIFYKDLDRTYLYDRMLRKPIKILLVDLNAKCGKETYFFQIMGSESLHEVKIYTR